MKRAVVVLVLPLSLALSGCAGLTWPAVGAVVGAVATHCFESVGNCVTNAKNDIATAKTVVADTHTAVEDLKPVVAAVHAKVAKVKAFNAAVGHKITAFNDKLFGWSVPAPVAPVVTSTPTVVVAQPAQAVGAAVAAPPKTTPPSPAPFPWKNIGGAAGAIGAIGVALLAWWRNRK